jgi:hypothetical protein
MCACIAYKKEKYRNIEKNPGNMCMHVPRVQEQKRILKNKRNPRNMCMHVPGGAKKERDPGNMCMHVPGMQRRTKKKKKERKTLANMLCVVLRMQNR